MSRRDGRHDRRKPTEARRSGALTAYRSLGPLQVEREVISSIPNMNPCGKKLTQIGVANGGPTADPHFQSSIGHHLWLLIVHLNDVDVQIEGDALLVPRDCDHSQVIGAVFASIVDVLDDAGLQLLVREPIHLRRLRFDVAKRRLLQYSIFENLSSVVVREWHEIDGFQFHTLSCAQGDMR